MENEGVNGKAESYFVSEMEEEEEYLKALNASLLIQTPLQVSLEVIQKRLKKQSKLIEGLKHKVNLQETASMNSRSLLERLQLIEKSLLDLKSSKLSPFMQCEIMERLDTLEEFTKEQDLQFKIHLEREALEKQRESGKKVEQAFLGSYPPDLRTTNQRLENELVDSMPTETECTHPNSVTVEVAAPKQLFEGEMKSQTEQTQKVLEEMSCQLSQMRSRLDSYESSTTDAVKKLEEKQSILNNEYQSEFTKLRAETAKEAQISSSEYKGVACKLRDFDIQLEQHGHRLNQKEETRKSEVQEFMERLSKVEKDVRMTEQRAETALSAAISTLEPPSENREFATIDQMLELRDQLLPQITLENIKDCVRDEIKKYRNKEDTNRTQNDSSTMDTAQPARGTRFVEVNPYRPEPVGELPSSQGLLPAPQEFKTKAVFQLQPIGPGLNAAELRKLQFMSEKSNNSNSSAKAQSKSTRRDSERPKTCTKKTPIFL